MEVGATCAAAGDCAVLGDDDDDFGSIFGGPDWRDWGWAIGWGLGRDAPLVIDGNLLEEFRADDDVGKAVTKIKVDLMRNSIVTCENPSNWYSQTGRTKKTVQLQDTIYSLGNTFIYWRATCKADLKCTKKRCPGWSLTSRPKYTDEDVPWEISVDCDITFFIKDKWENPVGNGADWTVNWWRDDGFPIEGSWEESFKSTSRYALPSGK